MSPHLDQVLYARAGWRKRVLVPLWTFQIFVLLSLMGIFAYRLVDTFDHYDEHEQTGRVPIVEVVYVPAREGGGGGRAAAATTTTANHAGRGGLTGSGRPGGRASSSSSSSSLLSVRRGLTCYLQPAC